MRPVAFFLTLLCVQSMAAASKSISLADARSAVEANLLTPEGKAFDEKLGTEFVQKHLAAVRQCRQTIGGSLEDFWILLKLEKDGEVGEVLLYPTTKLGTCARETLLKDKFLSPPRADYWVSIFMKLAH